jgi:hypothetical protein
MALSTTAHPSPPHLATVLWRLESALRDVVDAVLPDNFGLATLPRVTCAAAPPFSSLLLGACHGGRFSPEPLAGRLPQLLFPRGLRPLGLPAAA